MKPVRCAIYARYSSDMQSRRSAEDQIRECREYAARQGWTVVIAERDEATNASAMAGRAGYRPDSDRDLDGNGVRLAVRFEPCAVEAPIVREIFARYADGESKTSIARWLNERAVRPATQAGRTPADAFGDNGPRRRSVRC